MTKDEAIILDKILEIIVDKKNATLNDFPPVGQIIPKQEGYKRDIYSHYFEVLQISGLIEVYNSKSGIDTAPIAVVAQQFLKEGGFAQRLKEEKEKEDNEIEFRELQIKELKGNIFQVKFWWLFLLLSAIVSIFSAIITNLIIN